MFFMESNLQNAMTICIVGFSAVIIILSICAALISMLNKLNVMITDKKQNVTNIKLNDEQIDEETMAVIIAAVTAFMEQKTDKKVIKKILFSNPIIPNNAWNNITKTMNFQSHNINIQQRRKYNGK